MPDIEGNEYVALRRKRSVSPPTENSFDEPQPPIEEAVKISSTAIEEALGFTPTEGISQTDGTWSPSLNGGGGNPTVTYTYQLGMYVKTGKMFQFAISIAWSSISGGSGNLIITLPSFVNTNVTVAGGQVVNISDLRAFNSITFDQLSARVTQSSSPHILIKREVVGEDNNIQVSDLASSGTLLISGSIIADETVVV